MINLNKDSWQRKPFSFVADCVEKHDKNAIQNGLTKFIGLENLDGSSLSITGSGEIENGTTFSKTFQSSDVLFGKRRPYLRKVAIADFNGICSGDILVFRAKEKSILPDLLPLYVTSENFIQYAISTSAGSLSPRTKWRDLAKYEIPLPPLPEQKQIATLFQSIETAMEAVDGQEKNLKRLQKSLVDGLFESEPEFGNLLNKKNCTATSFGEIADCDKKYSEHEKEVERFVGLEFLEAESFDLQGWGEIANGTTFSKRFAKGDVLFGKRRAYLKKVAVADFDGICSGDILVIRAKAKKMLQELLPFYISSDAFINHAVSTSAGSLSPRTKWKDLADLEVSIPDLKTQERILEVFTQLQITLQQLKQQKTTLKHLKQKLLNEILG